MSHNRFRFYLLFKQCSAVENEHQSVCSIASWYFKLVKSLPKSMVFQTTLSRNNRQSFKIRAQEIVFSFTKLFYTKIQDEIICRNILLSSLKRPTEHFSNIQTTLFPKGCVRQYLNKLKDGKGRSTVLWIQESQNTEELGVEAAVSQPQQEAAEHGHLFAEGESNSSLKAIHSNSSQIYKVFLADLFGNCEWKKAITLLISLEKNWECLTWQKE